MKILDNQYIKGRGTTTMFSVGSYYYIVNEKGETYHHDGKWRKKPLIDLSKYKFKSFDEAEKKVSELKKII